MAHPEASAKEVDDLLTEVEDLTLQDEKREDKPKKDKKKKDKSSKPKTKGMAPPNMGPPPTMGPPAMVPSMAPGKSSRGGLSSRGDKGAAPPVEDDGTYVVDDVDDFASPVKQPPAKVNSQNVSEAKKLSNPANGGDSPTGAKQPSSDTYRNSAPDSTGGSDFGSAGALGGQSAQSRARVLAQQRELQMKRRQQAMLGTTSMLRSTDRSSGEGPLSGSVSSSLEQHTPAMRQFGPKSDQQGTESVSGRDPSLRDQQIYGSTESFGSGHNVAAPSTLSPNRNGGSGGPYGDNGVYANPQRRSGPGNDYPEVAPQQLRPHPSTSTSGSYEHGLPPNEQDDDKGSYNAYSTSHTQGSLYGPGSPGSNMGPGPGGGMGPGPGGGMDPGGNMGPGPGGGMGPGGNMGPGPGGSMGPGGNMGPGPGGGMGPGGNMGPGPGGGMGPGGNMGPGPGGGMGPYSGGFDPSAAYDRDGGYGYGRGDGCGGPPDMNGYPGGYPRGGYDSYGAGYGGGYPGGGYEQGGPMGRGGGMGGARGGYGGGMGRGGTPDYPNYAYGGEGYGGPMGPGAYPGGATPCGGLPGGNGGPGGGGEGNDAYGRDPGYVIASPVASVDAGNWREEEESAKQRYETEKQGGKGGKGMSGPYSNDPYAKGDDQDQDGQGGGMRGGGSQREEGGGAPPSPNAAAADFDINSLNLTDAGNLREFLMRPCSPEAGVMQTYIKRKKSTFSKMFPEYRVYLKVPGMDRDLFLMCGKKRSGQKTSNYLITMSEEDLRRSSSSYLGKLRANFVGTEFRIYDNGSNPDDVDGDDPETSAAARQELGVVQYESNVMGSRGPRRMQVGLPRVLETEGAEGAVFQPSAGRSTDSMMAKFKKRDFTKMVVAYNKPPRWNDTVGAFVLNFNGRVTMASVKNFQLITHDDQEKIILQFGRVAKDEFTMDFQWPMTPFQAFAITLSSFDSKIACD